MYKVPRIGLIGIGGMGSVHLEIYRTLHQQGRCKLVAVADPTARERFPETLAALAREGCAHYDDYRQLLSRTDVDAVVISTPIHLHASQTRDALAAGKHVFLEKPPCATLAELDQLESAWRDSELVCAVGFQMQASPLMAFVRSVVVSGEIGEIEQIWGAGRLPRGDSYYGRASWAGRLTVDGAPVFDGPAINAMGHAVHAAMSLAGKPSRVRGAMRRARPIESYDTAYLEADTVGGVNVRIALTHATATETAPSLRVRGTRGEIEFDWNMRATLRKAGEPARNMSFPSLDVLGAALDFLAALSGERLPATQLPGTRPFLQIVSGAYQSGGGVETIGSRSVFVARPEAQVRVYQVDGLDDDIDLFLCNSGSIPSAITPGDWVAVSDIRSFAEHDFGSKQSPVPSVI